MSSFCSTHRRCGLPALDSATSYDYACFQGKFLDIRKNRFDGTLGHVPILYDLGSQTFRETTPGQGVTLNLHAEFSAAPPQPSPEPLFTANPSGLFEYGAVVKTVGGVSLGSESGSFAAKVTKKLGRPRKVPPSKPVTEACVEPVTADVSSVNGSHASPAVAPVYAEPALVNGSVTRHVNGVHLSPGDAASTLIAEELDASLAAMSESTPPSGSPSAPGRKPRRLKSVIPEEIIMS